MESTPYLIFNARYAKGKKIIQVRDSRDGYRGRASYLAEAVGGRYVGRSGGYTVSPTAADKFEKLFAAGFDGDVPLFGGKATFSHRERGLRGLTAAQALKLV